MCRSLYLLILLIASAESTVIAGEGNGIDQDVVIADCTWQPISLFANAYVQSPVANQNEPLHLRKEPSYATILPSTAPFDWRNSECNLWPGMRLRIADWGSNSNRFAKVYYDGHIYWVSKAYREGGLSVIPAGSKSGDSKRRLLHAGPKH